MRQDARRTGGSFSLSSYQHFQFYPSSVSLGGDGSLHEENPYVCSPSSPPSSFLFSSPGQTFSLRQAVLSFKRGFTLRRAVFNSRCLSGSFSLFPCEQARSAFTPASSLAYPQPPFGPLFSLSVRKPTIRLAGFCYVERTISRNFFPRGHGLFLPWSSLLLFQKSTAPRHGCAPFPPDLKPSSFFPSPLFFLRSRCMEQSETGFLFCHLFFVFVSVDAFPPFPSFVHFVVVLVGGNRPPPPPQSPFS